MSRVPVASCVPYKVITIQCDSHRVWFMPIELLTGAIAVGEELKGPVIWSRVPETTLPPSYPWSS